MAAWLLALAAALHISPSCGSAAGVDAEMSPYVSPARRCAVCGGPDVTHGRAEAPPTCGDSVGRTALVSSSSTWRLYFCTACGAEPAAVAAAQNGTGRAARAPRTATLCKSPGCVTRASFGRQVVRPLCVESAVKATDSVRARH